MRHLMLSIALVSFAGLDVIFVEFSDTPTAALVFALLSFSILLLLSGSAGSMVAEPGDSAGFQGPEALWDGGGPAARVVMASIIPVALLLAAAFIRDFDDPLAPNETAQLGSTIAVFWLLMSLGLVGAILGFIWPRTGLLEAVLVGALVVLAQGLISWLKVGANREAIQLALYTWMIWVSVCLIGAWVGIVLREVGSRRVAPVAEEADSGYLADPD